MNLLALFAGLVACAPPQPATAASMEAAVQATGVDDAEVMSAALQVPSLRWTAPTNHVLGTAFPVEVRVQAGKGETIPMAWTTPEGFLVNGEPIGAVEGTYEVNFDQSWSLKFDLGPYLKVQKDFTLQLVGDEAEPRTVQAFRRAPAGTDFMSLSPDELAKWYVLLRTNRGDMLASFWPDVAPGHVKNFLDLAHTGFYDGILFHRCIPGFMIQGGDPQTKDPNADKARFGSGNGPRRVDAEFSDRPHERGTLSAARLGNDVNSATSQFFICHQRAASLDRSYSAFGALVSGFDVLDQITTSPKDIDVRGVDPRTGQPQRIPSDRPLEPQRIEHAWVVVPLGG